MHRTHDTPFSSGGPRFGPGAVMGFVLALAFLAAFGIADGFVPGAAHAQTAAPSNPATMTFARNLTIGDKGNDVLALQTFLNANGFTLATSGPGSPGSETTYFGPLTRDALAHWQAAVGISPAAGYFGPITRAAINSTSGGSGATSGNGGMTSSSTATSTPSSSNGTSGTTVGPNGPMIPGTTTTSTSPSSSGPVTPVY